MSGWTLEAFKELKGRGVPATVIKLCKNVNSEGRALEYRGAGIKYYEKTLKKAEDLFKQYSTLKGPRIVEIKGGENPVYRKVSDWNDKDLARLKVTGSYNTDRFLSELETYIKRGRDVIPRVKKNIIVLRASAQTIVGIMEQVQQLDKSVDKKLLSQRREALFAQAEKYARTAYGVTQAETRRKDGDSEQLIKEFAASFESLQRHISIKS